ncbi:MAG TPA: ribonuclease Z [Pyrinomonadaceae bacterium]
MSHRKFIALGTASQVPTRDRNHNGYFVRWDEHGFLFDPGEGTQRQMTFAGVSASEITKIFITHFHGDHCLGLPGVLQRLSLDRIAHAVEIYYPASGQRYFDNLKNASIYTKTAEIIEKPIAAEGIVFQDKNLVIETKKLEHSSESWGYRFQEPDSVTMLPEKLKEFGIGGRDIGKLKETGAIEINGKIVRRKDASVFKKGQSFAFVMDTGVCGAAYELAKDVDFLIIESTFLSSESKEAFDYRHLTAQQAAEIARDANAKQLVLTHFSQRYMNIEDFAAEAREIFPNSIAVYDGQEIEFRREKVL